MAFANGIYDHGYLGNVDDLGCGCQSPPRVEASSGFDLSKVPLWAWVAAGAAVFLMVTKKQGR